MLNPMDVSKPESDNFTANQIMKIEHEVLHSWKEKWFFQKSKLVKAFFNKKLVSNPDLD